MEAANAGNVAMLQEILKAGVSISSQADDGRTALHCAARAGHVEVFTG
jgi:ankyrin repeat protein